MKRLQAIFSLISPCELFADIGTDHGQIAAYAAMLARRVVATDISEKCLLKAKNSIKAKNVEFAVGDGLTVLHSDPDIIAICGMGGHTVTNILVNYRGKAALILQPQNDVPHLRRFLGEIGYVITHDIVAFEGGKFYDIIRAIPSVYAENPKAEGHTLDSENHNAGKLTDPMLLFGKFYQTPNPFLKNRLIKLGQSYQSYKPTDENLEFLNQIKHALAYQP